MPTTITATFEDGVFKPDEPVTVRPGSRVKVVIDEEERPDLERVQELWDSPERKAAWGRLKKILLNTPVKPGGTILTREQLHERR